MNTDSIKNYVKCLDDDNYELVQELKINQFSINGDINAVDFNDLTYFPNLKKITLCNLMINYNDFLTIFQLKKLKIIEFIDCDIIGNIEETLNLMNIEELLFDNTKINFSIITSSYKKITIRNIFYEINNINTEILDISKANINYNDLKFNTKNLIISHTQYVNNQEKFNELKNLFHITIKNDKYDEVEGEL